MSLQLLAKQMEAKGRKGDSMLVHMTPGEVAGLQKLAESAGGSLTVNPETGLVEANFLKKLLPTLLGFGITAATGGAAAPWMVGLGVGGFEALRTGDVKKGLMAGLGAAGGSSLAAGIGAAGSQAAAQTAGQKTAEEVAKEKLATEAIQKTAAENAVANAGQAEAANMMTLGGEGATQQAFMSQQQQMGADQVLAAQQKAAADYAAQGTGERLGQGIQALGDTSGREAFGTKFGMKQAAMAAAPMMVPEEQKMVEEPVDDEMYAYTFDPGRTYAERTPTASSAERMQFAGNYSPMRRIRARDYLAAKGGLLSYAEGGATGEMSGASKAAFDYLMGNAPSSSAGLPALSVQAPAAQPTEMDSGRMYTFDPATGTYTKNPNYVDPTAKKESDGLLSGLLSDQQRYDQSYYGSRANYEGGNAEGGLIGLAKGGMASGGFVVPADVVSMVGEGNTDAGYKRIKAMIPGATAIKGKDGGQADTVKTSIDGKKPARVAHGEMYIPPATVKRMGGAKKLYAMMDRVRAQATGSTKQIRPVSLKKAMA